MWRQHDVYYQALGIIAGKCQEYFRLAHSLIGDAGTGWVFIDSFDHRTLQAPHDVLAAVWRYLYENKVRQMELPGIRSCRAYDCPWITGNEKVNLDRLWGGWQCPKPDCNWLKGEEVPDFAGLWLDWLRDEVRSWEHSPHLVRLVIQILTNQNEPEGYQAEDALRCDLIARYGNVPWTRTKCTTSRTA